jgi:hypothetical protein
MEKYLRVWLFVAVTAFLCPLALAQSLDPAGLKNPGEREVFLELIGDLQQEFPKQESSILLEYGYESPEHLALRDSIRRRDDTLRAVMDQYLNLYGFPDVAEPDSALWKKAQTELFEEMKRIPKGDNMARDSVIRLVAARYPRSITAINYSWVVVRVLETEPEFEKRCEAIGLLRFEYERGSISLVSMLAFLRHTYLLRYGQELGIVSGTTERERLEMYARELSGCWGN